MPNIACNLLYNNGNEGTYVGFAGPCTIGNIAYNVRKGDGRWCSQPRCSCRIFYDRDFSGALSNEPCNESFLFTKWEWNAGENFETREPFYLRQPVEGKVAVLTTIFAGQKERDRKIVGFFKIDRCIDEKVVFADNTYRLRLLRDEADELNFWEYHRNQKGTQPDWRQGRFRYLEDDQTAAFLHDLAAVVQSGASRSMILDLLRSDFRAYAETRPVVNGYLAAEAVMRTLLKRKYGKGGESANHRNLKNYIASHPEIIGLERRFVRAKIEHPYISGDLVDILFEPVDGGTNTVVEIELDIVVPGVHQAIKYRALRCAELGRPLDDLSVRAVVVAWNIDRVAADLCRRYGIEFYEHRL